MRMRAEITGLYLRVLLRFVSMYTPQGAAAGAKAAAKGGATEDDVAEAKGAKGEGGGAAAGSKAAVKFDDDMWSKETDYYD